MRYTNVHVREMGEDRTTSEVCQRGDEANFASGRFLSNAMSALLPGLQTR